MSYIFEIFSNSRYWQEIVRGESAKLRAIFEHIFNFARLYRISMNHNLDINLSRIVDLLNSTLHDAFSAKSN